MTAITKKIFDGVCVVKLNRPDVYNAINKQLADELLEAFVRLKNNEQVKVVVLTGEGKAFCSGQDLQDRTVLQMKDGMVALGEVVRNRYNPLINAIHNVGKPVVAAVNGIAAGAGCSLALACDVRFITPKTKFVEAFVRVGLVPDSGSSYFLPRIVGLGNALDIAMSGRDVLAEEAKKIGLANYVVDQDKLFDEVLAYTKTLVNGPPAAIKLTRDAIYRGTEMNLEDSLELEAKYQDEVGKTKDFLEGISAFNEKRKPTYSGA